MENQSHRLVLKRVGWVLIGIGVIDIAVMVYCIVKRISYSSSLNVFALIAGIFLIRGGLKTAGGVRWFAVFLGSAFTALLVAWPLVQPVELTMMQIRHSSMGSIAETAFAGVTLVLLFWIVRELRQESIQQARDAAGLKRGDMRIPAALGVSLLVVAGVGQKLLLGGESAERAKAIAEKAVGPGYRLHVTALRITESSNVKTVSGVVTAWNNKEIKEIPVHWEENRN